MFLAVDVGNTNINLGTFQKDRIIKKFIIPTRGYRISILKNALGKTDIDNCIISSVVPDITKSLERDLGRICNDRVYVLGKNADVPIRNLYRRPSQVGQDRLVNAYAGVILYGAPLIIVDFGTAVTFDLVSARGEYSGGIILPGLQVSLDALAGRTALLPEIKLDKPREFIGRDTKNSMLSGIVYGFAALTDTLVQEIKNRIGQDAKVIGTGGNIGFIRKYCRGFDRIDADLTLKGLNIIYMRGA